jgi:hypothetical protein
VRIYLLTFFVLIECALSACGIQKGPPQDWISQQWSRSMASYNILPVYPPSEDVYVGDIYAYGTDATAIEGNLFSSVKIDSVSVQKELDESYRLHPIFPDTTAKPPSADDIWVQPSTVDGNQSGVVSKKGAADKGKVPPGKGDVAAAAEVRKDPPSVFSDAPIRTKLALIVFPAFTLANADAESLGLSVPLRFFQTIFGASRTHADTITIKISAAETYGLPVRVARDKFQNWCNDKITRFSCTDGNARAELASIRPVKDDTRVGLAFINRVYLARSIEYTYNGSTEAGVSGDFTVTLQKALDNQKTLQAALAEKPASGAVGASGPSADQIGALKDVRASLDELLARLQKMNQQSIGSPAPGATFSVGSVSSQGVTLIQTFERPVAIGYRAVILNP